MKVILWSNSLGGTLRDKVYILRKYLKRGCVKCQEEMVLDQLGVGCVMDPVEKPVGEASKLDKKDKGPRVVGEKADVRSELSVKKVLKRNTIPVTCQKIIGIRNSPRNYPADCPYESF